MPYVDLHCTDDYTSIFYTTNSPRGNVGGFDPEKPSVIILPPMFLDTTWLHLQFGDPRLTNNFNLIAFDMRVCGRSTARPTGRHDSWVEAADLAFCHQALYLPPCHVLALESVSIYCALRFALLFPEMCLSLTLCNVPPPTEWIFTAYDELLQSWCFAEDLESFEHVAKESVAFVTGPNCDPDMQDDMIAYWEVAMPPICRKRIVENLGVLMNRTPLTPEAYASINQPVLLIHGERNETCPKKYAEKLSSQLTGARHGAVLYIVKGASGTLSIIPSHASIANMVFARFLSRLPHTRSDLVRPEIPKEERMKLALSTLAGIMGDPSIASRNPLSPLSFSCLQPDVVKIQTETLQRFRVGPEKVFSPLGPDGRPIRKFSERKSEHWFQGEVDGHSIAGTSFLPTEREPEKSASRLEPESKEDSRKCLAAFTSSPVDKLVIKGSMNKVVGTASTTPFQRLVI